MLADAPVHAVTGPTLVAAQRYAHRTFVDDPSVGHHSFALNGARATVRAADGSTITAFPIRFADTADGTGQAVLLFRGTRFLGWASATVTLRLKVAASGSAIRVTYAVYKGNDAFCCPSSRKTVRYRWTGTRIGADATPPRLYGKLGAKLHLQPTSSRHSS